MILVLLAEGFEELEALSPVDILRREGLDVRTVGIGARRTVTGAHGISVVADLMPHEVEDGDIDAVVLPGGMPGTLNLDASAHTDRFIAAAMKNGGRLAAICAAPLVLGRRGLLNGKRATCFNGFEDELIGAIITDTDVITDGNITTARDFRAAVAFGDELKRLLSPKRR